MPVSSLTLGKAKIDRLEFTPDEIDQLKAKLLALTEAKVIVRSPQRNAQGKLDYVEVPDTGIQLAATVKALEFGVGKPRQMMEIQTTGSQAPAKQDLGKLLAKNPELMDTVLAAIKESVANQQAIPVQAEAGDLRPRLSESDSVGAQR